MTPEQRAQAAQAEASALEPDHIGHGELLETGEHSSDAAECTLPLIARVIPDQPWAAYGKHDLFTESGPGRFEAHTAANEPEAE
jgi:hypothetical protein